MKKKVVSKNINYVSFISSFFDGKFDFLTYDFFKNYRCNHRYQLKIRCFKDYTFYINII